ncbi:MAG TPA: trans-splicing intein-formed DNA polymerase III subunit alpha C-terminal partner DnaE-C [Cyanobacteria bacterium UBA9273]|nr:trans-splicing intein-formed DNA polymerase III subunit alpha C-terminal partner DnaE-C [Cyanobacteria bacterium UBA9273]
MVKIISRKSLGTQSVYDIGVERDHNFILANGLVASNCFNKSHSTAYGYVTYQTAYLKANYPVEYMTALLTASSGTQDKVQKYIATCATMGIDVLQPDINRSDIDFTPVGEKILFGLSAIRNLGEGAIEGILKARETDGLFQSLADFCDRVDLRTVNRRALESLIHCGAFDSIAPNRHQLIKDLDLVISWAQKRAEDRQSGQLSIFDGLVMGNGNQNSSNDAWKSAPRSTAVPDYSPQEKLRLEKELLGFYVSDHPLKLAHQLAKVLSPISLHELAEQSKRATLSAIVMLTSVKPHVTKTGGESMAFVQMEDLTGQAEGVIFPKTYKRISPIIQTDARLIVWGKVDQREEQYQLIIEDAEPIESVQMVVVELTPQRVNANELRQLKSILEQHSGDKYLLKAPVLARVAASDPGKFVRLDSKYWVQDSTETVTALNAAGFRAYTKPFAGG